MYDEDKEYKYFKISWRVLMNRLLTTDGSKKCGHFTLFSKYLENRSKIVRYNLQFFYTHLLHIQLWKSLIHSRFGAPRQFFLRVQKIPNNSSSMNTKRDKRDMSTIKRIVPPENLAPPKKQHKWINTWLKNKKTLGVENWNFHSKHRLELS